MPKISLKTMSMADISTQYDTKPTYGLTNNGSLEDQHLARNALRDLMLFNNAIQGEMQKMRSEAKKGVLIDSALYEKMLRVQNSYDYAMTGFKAFDDEMERAALTSLSEAIDDLLKFIKDRSN